MEKSTLKKIIREVIRELEIKKSVNDSQFEFYRKKKRRIERKERVMMTASSNYWDKISGELGKCEEAEKTKLIEKYKKGLKYEINT